ncbi:MAG: response regulator transcription factor [Cyanobacteria bacterium P01_A01_bin.114]
MTPIRIALIEDHDLTRMGLRTALKQAGFDCVGEAANGRQGLHMLAQAQPDVALVDIGLPDMDGIELIEKFKSQQAESPTRILMLTMHSSEKAVLAAFAAGADSYCTKEIKTEDLVQAVQETYEGNAWLDPAIASIVLQQMKEPVGSNIGLQERTVEIRAVDPDYGQIIEAYPLTKRELEILELIVSGNSNAQIGEKLFVTVGTVKTHVRNILNKLGANDRTQAAVRALRSGLVS